METAGAAKLATTAEKECFVISPIGAPGSEIRKKSDQVFKHIIQKTLTPLNYKAIRADQIAEPGMITSQIIQRLNDSPLVIADLSSSNPNVFYELAVRHAADKPVIQLITTDEKIPFDVSQERTIPYDLGNLDTVDAARDELEKQIKAIESKKIPADNPITVAIGMKLLKESTIPEQRSIGEVLEEISSLRAEVRHMSKTPGRASSVLRRHRVQAVEILDSLEEERSRALSELKKVTEILNESPKLTKPAKEELEGRIEFLQQKVSELEDQIGEARSHIGAD